MGTNYVAAPGVVTSLAFANTQDGGTLRALSTDRLYRQSSSDPSRIAPYRCAPGGPRAGDITDGTILREVIYTPPASVTPGDTTDQFEVSVQKVFIQNRAEARQPNQAGPTGGPGQAVNCYADGAAATQTITLRRPIAPTITAGNEAIMHAENTPATTPVATYTTDDTNSIAWSVGGGTDADLFLIDPTSGALTFKASPNYEIPTDDGGDRVYDITITATETNGVPIDLASEPLVVTVTIINVDEPGVIGAITGTAQVGQTLTAGTVESDPDAVTASNAAGTVSVTPAHQWQSAAEGADATAAVDDAAWTDIGTTTPTYMPEVDDVGRIIRVVATYTAVPGFISQTAASAATGAVAAAPLSTDATLSALTLADNNNAAVALVPATFAPETTTYTASVANGVASVTVILTKGDPGASTEVSVDTGASGGNTASEVIALAVGENLISIIVTAEDTTVATQTYAVTVTRAAPTPSIALAADTGADTSDGITSNGVVNVTLASTFDRTRDTWHYSTDGSDPGSTAGTNPASGTDASFDLGAAGLGLADGTYQIRVRQTIDSAVSLIASLAVTLDTTAPVIALAGGPVTVAHGGTYTEMEDAGISGAGSDDATATTTASPDATVVSGIAVDTNTAGDYTITYTATDRAGNVSDPVTRTVTVSPALSADATLSGLTIAESGNDVALMPNFNAATDTYTADVGTDVASITVTPTVTDTTGAAVTVGGTTVASGQPSGVIGLSPGNNTITIIVTAANGSTRQTYTVTVARAVPAPGISLVDTGAGAGADSDGITMSGRVDVTLATGATAWAYTIKDGTPTMVPDTSVTFFTLPEGVYEVSEVQVVQTVNSVDSAPATFDTQITVDTTAPTIALTGGDTPIVLTAGGTYTEPGATATDNVDTSVPTPTPSGMVNTTTAGQYTITYTATDRAGNVATKTRTVTVNADLVLSAPGDQDYTAGRAITVLELPAATGGTAPLRYTLTGVLPTGLTFDTGTRTLSGTPSTAASATTLTYTVTDTNDATTSQTFTVTVNASLVLTTAGDQNYTAGRVITALELPEATGGTAPLAYTLTGDLPDGLDFTAGTRTLSGTPSTAASATELTYTVTDDNGASASQTFNVVVAAAPSLSTDATLSGLTISQGSLLPAFSTDNLPYTATVPNNVASVMVTPTTNDGGATVTVNGDAVDSGEASEAITLAPGVAIDITIEVTAEDASTQAYTVAVTRTANTAPRITAGSAALNYQENESSTVEDYDATDDEGNTITWSVGGTDANLFTIDAAGELGFNTPPNFEVPTDAGGNHVYDLTVTATDNGTPNEEHTLDVVVTVINVEETGIIGPISGTAQVGVALTAGTVTDPDAVTPTNLAGTVAVADITYQWQSVDGATTTGIGTDMTYMPGVGDEGKTIQVIATYTDGFDSGNTVTSNPTAAVQAAAPTAALALPNVPLLRFTVNTAISLTLPEATGGTAPLTYMLVALAAGASLPPGLDFDANTRTLSGTPTVNGRTNLGYTVTDANAISTNRRFGVSVQTGLTLNPPSDQFYTVGTAISLVLSAAGGTSGGELTYTLTGPRRTDPLPTGLTFAAASRTLSGTPSEVTSETSLTYHVSEAGGGSATATFKLTVVAAPADTTPPTVATFDDPAAGVIDTEQTHTITFSEAVTGLEVGDFDASTDVTVNSVTPVSGAHTTYTIAFTPTAATFTLTLAINSVSDTATPTPNMGPASAASADGTATPATDTTPPTVATFDDPAAGMIDTEQTHTITFSEAVTGLEVGDFDASTDVTVNSVTPDSGAHTTYTIAFTPTAATFTLTLAINSVSDTATPTPNLGPASAASADGTAAPALSTDSTLSALDVSAGTLNPAFASGTDAYAVSLDTGVTSIRITPTVTDTGKATVTVNGDTVASGEASEVIALAVGNNLISIIVTAEDSSAQTYTVTVARAVPPPGIDLSRDTARDGGTNMDRITRNRSIVVTLHADFQDGRDTWEWSQDSGNTPYTTGSNAGRSFSLATNQRTYQNNMVGARQTVNGVTSEFAGLARFTHDSVKPIINLNGASVTIPAGVAYKIGDGDPATTTDVFDGVNFNDGFIEVTSSPEFDFDNPATGSYTFTYNVMDRAGNPATAVNRLVTVSEPVVTALALTTVDNQNYTVGTEITALELPEATGGTAPLAYTLTGALPDGLAFDTGTRTLSGTPSTAASATTLTYTVTDSAPTPVVATQTFTVIVNDRLVLTTVDNQNYTVDTAITDLVLPEATGGTAPRRYSLTGHPAGLNYDGASRTLSGTPTVTGTTTLTYTVTDSAPTPVVATQTFNVVVAAAADTAAPVITFVRFGHTGGMVDGTTTYLNVDDTLTVFVNSTELLADASLTDAAVFDIDGDKSAQNLVQVGATNEYSATYTITRTDNDTTPVFKVSGVTDTADTPNTADDFTTDLGTVIIDTTAPTVDFDINNLADGVVGVLQNHDITFSEVVTGLATTGLSSSQDAAVVLVSGSDSRYTLSITPGDAGYILILAAAAVTDLAGNPNAEARVTISDTVNRLPVAHAGADQSDAVTGTQVTLDGSGSTDSDSINDLTYAWAHTSTDGSAPNPSVTITEDGTATDDPTTPAAVFTPTVEGVYIFTLTVTDKFSTPASDSDTVTITVTEPAATAPPSIDLATDTGADTSDGITSNGVVNVTLASDFDPSTDTWHYSTDGSVPGTAGTNPASGTDASFTLDEGVYEADDVQVRQTVNSVVSEVASLGVVTIDTTKPVIALAGDPVTVDHGGTYTEAEDAGISGAGSDDTTATTTTSPDATVVSGIAVDTNTAGVYTITYIATDLAGNDSDPVTRIVTVSAPTTDTTPPTVTLGTIAAGVIGTPQDHDITFSEAVTGLEVGDFGTSADVTVNSVTPASGAHITYTISITPRAIAFDLTLAADSVMDTAVTPNAGPAGAVSADGTATLALAFAAGGSPALTTSNADAQRAKDGDILTLAFTVNQALASDPVVTIAGQSITATKGSGNDYTATYTVLVTDTDGERVSFSTGILTAAGAAGNTERISGDSGIRIDLTAPTITLNLDAGGNTHITLEVGDAYNELGAAATDTVDATVPTPTPSGTVDTNTAAEYTITYTATDRAGNEATLTRTVTVREPVAVDTLTLPALADQSYTVGTPITDLVLPEATGGSTPRTYTLTGPGGGNPPPGLTYTAASRTLSGTPSATSGSRLTYTVTDDNGDTDIQTFFVTVMTEPENTAPVIDTANVAVNHAENTPITTAVATYTTDDTNTVEWSHAGTDADLFLIDPTSGDLTFKALPDYEIPTDAGGDRVYDLTITATETDGDPSNLISDALAVTVTVIDVNEDGAATITGTVQVGQTLTAGATDPDAVTSGNPNGDVTGSNYRWVSTPTGLGSSSTDIANGPSATYMLKPADSGKTIRVEVTYMDGQLTKNVRSADTGVVIAAPVPNTAPVIDTADVAVDHAENTPITTAVATYTTDDTNTVEWSHAGTDADLFLIDPASGALTFKALPDYEIPTDDGGDRVYDITITATETDGDPSNLISDALAVTVTVTNVEEGNGTVTIGGIAQVGMVLTAEAVVGDPDNFVSADKHQWQSVDGSTTTDIGTDQNTYTPAVADIGKTIQVVVTYTDGHGSGKEATSAATRAVLAEDVVLSTDATLSGLSIADSDDNEVALVPPTFDSARETYTADVDNGVDSVTITPTTTDTDASVDVVVNDAPPVSDQASVPAALNVGVNNIAIEVTAEDGSQKTYNLTVTRAENTAPVANAGNDRTVNAGFRVFLSGRASNDPDGNNLNLRYVWEHTLTDGNPPASPIDLTHILDRGVFDAPTATGELTITLTVTDAGTPAKSHKDTVVITVTTAALAFTVAPVLTSSNAGDYAKHGDTLSLTFTTNVPIITEGDAKNGISIAGHFAEGLTGVGNVYTATYVANALSLPFRDLDGAGVTFEIHRLTATEIAHGTIENQPLETSMIRVDITAPRVMTFEAPAAAAIDTVHTTPITFSEPVTGLAVSDFYTSEGVMVTGVTPSSGFDTTYTITFRQTAATFTLTLAPDEVADRAGNTGHPLVPISAGGVPAANNMPPTVDVGIDRTVNVGAPVILSSTVTDPENGALDYAWRQSLLGDAPALVALTDDDTATATFTAPTTQGVYQFTLVVTDAATNQVADSIVITVVDATLSDLAITHSGSTTVELMPTFASGILNYTASLGNDVASVNIRPTLSDTTASVTVGGTVVTSGTESGDISLSSGANPIRIVVTPAADSNFMHEYEVVVTRAADTTTAPGAPTSLAAEAGDTMVTLTWTAPTATGGAAITGYEYRQSTTAGTYDDATSPWIAIPDSAAATEYIVTGLTNGDTYYFEVRAVNSVGEGEVPSEASTTPTATVDTTLMVNAGADQTNVLEGATVNLVGTIANPGTDPVILRTHTMTNGQPVTPGEALDITDPDMAVASFIAPYVTVDTILTFELSVTLSGGGNSPVTDTVDIIISNVAQPRTIASVAVNAGSPAQSAFAVSWTQASDTDKDPTTGFDVEYKVTGADDSTYAATNVAVTDETAAITGLTASTGYTVRVRAKAGSGGTTEVAGDYVTGTGTTAADTTVPGALALTAPDDQSYTAGTMITELELPAATGGIGELTYTLTGPPADTALPAGLDFNADSRTLSGTPTAAASATELTYTVTDANDATTSQTFTVVVVTGLALNVPGDQSYTVDTAINLILPEATGGIGELTYTLTGPPADTALPAGLDFNADSRTLSGTPTAAASATTLTYRVTDAGRSGDEARISRKFNLTVNAALALTAQADQSYTAGTMITDLELPAATGGTEPLVYTLAPLPAGLTFDAASRTLSGTPTTAASATTLTYTVTDANGAGTSQTFDVTVAADTTPPSDPSPTDPTPEPDPEPEPNTAPVADAGAPPIAAEGARVTLNGRGSSDPDDDTLTYAWRQTGGTSVSLSGANTATPGFTAPSLLSADAELVFRLTVSDGSLSATDTVTVTVTHVNDAPGADAGEPQTVAEGAAVTLRGTGTDPDGDDAALRYAWSQTDNDAPRVSLSGADTATPSFTAPSLLSADAELVFRLTVSDGAVSATDTVVVTVTYVNDAPDADAGEPQTVAEGATVTLRGTGTDPDGDDTALRYAWSQTDTGAPRVSLSGADTATPSFTAPSLQSPEAVLTFMLTVTDAQGATGTDRVQITVETDTAAREQALEVSLAAFGRTVAAGAVDAIGHRLKPASPETRENSLGASLAACVASLTLADTADASLAPADTADTTPAPTMDALWPNPNDDNDDNLTPNRAGSSCRLPSREQLARSTFLIPLSGLIETDTADADTGGWSLWGRGDFSRFEGRPQHELSLDGEVMTGYLGLDYRLETGALVGLALSRSSGEVDYRSGAADGELDIDLDTVYPYGYWSPRPGLGLWGLLGIGRGDATLTHSATLFEADLDMRMGAFGVRQALRSVGDVELALKADAFMVELESEAMVGLPAITAQASRARLMLEGRTTWQVQPDAWLGASVELGARADGGDADEGAGIELGAGVEYDHTSLGLSAALRVQGLLAHKQSGFEEWGASLNILLDPGVPGRGLALSLAPVWGQAPSDGAAQALWESDRALEHAGVAQRPSARLDLDLSYAMDGMARLTPFAKLTLADGIARRLRMGLRVNRSDGLELEVFAGRDASEQSPPEYLLGVTGELRF